MTLVYSGPALVIVRDSLNDPAALPPNEDQKRRIIVALQGVLK